MKVTIFSNAYFDYENRKNIRALSFYLDVCVVLPKRSAVLIHPEKEFRLNNGEGGDYIAIDSVRITNALYFLKTLTFGLRRFSPDILVLEYNPWSIIFFQAIFARALFYRKAKLVSLVKKNTFRKSFGVKGVIKGFAARFCIRRCNHIIAASDMAKTMLIDEFSMPWNKIDVGTHVGIDVELFSPCPEKNNVRKTEVNTIIVGYCGRFEDIKGLPDLLHAVKKVRQQNAGLNIQLRLLGGGGYASNMDKEVRALAARESWLDVVPPVEHFKVADFLRKLDIFVLPARVGEDHQEHDAQSLIEAMASGVACIGTTSGIIPEILGDGTGIVVEYEAPEALAQAILELANNREKRTMLANKARKKATQVYSIEAVAQRRVDIYQKVRDE